MGHRRGMTCECVEYGGEGKANDLTNDENGKDNFVLKIDSRYLKENILKKTKNSLKMAKRLKRYNGFCLRILNHIPN